MAEMTVCSILCAPTISVMVTAVERAFDEETWQVAWHHYVDF